MPEVWAAMAYWRALGKIVVIDLDDMYEGLPPSNPAFKYWILNYPGLDPNPIDALAEGLRHADALTSPSKVILKDWEHIVPGFWMPNWTRGAWYAGLDQKPAGAQIPDIEFYYEQKEGAEPQLMKRARANSEGHIILGWGGSISHVDSWIYSGVIEALERLFEKYPNVRLKFCGHESRLNYIFEKFGDRIVRQDGLSPQHWPLAVSTFDIGLAPLDLRKLDPWREGAPIASYDERRSWLKGAEYLTAGVPWVGSKSLTYEDLARWGTLVDNTPEAWFAALDSKIQFLANEKAKAWSNRRWALKHMTFENNVDKYISTFGRILALKAKRNKEKLPEISYSSAPSGTDDPSATNGVAFGAGTGVTVDAQAVKS